MSQAFFLILFVFLLVESRLPQDIYLDYSITLTAEQDIDLDYPVKLFFQLNPLIWITSLISGHQWIKGFGWALGIIALTFFSGKVLCGFICPFGTIHHMVSYIRPALKKQSMIYANQKHPSQRFKYFLLILFLVLF